MALTIKPENGSLRVTGDWLASQESLENYAEQLFLVGYGEHTDAQGEPREYSDQSTPERLAIINDHMVQDAKNRAAANRDRIDKEAAKLVTEAYVEENLSFE